MNNLKKIVSIFFFLGFIFTLAISKTYSSDGGIIPTFLNYSDFLSYKYKGFDIGIKSLQIAETFDDNITFSKENLTNDFITDIGFVFGVNYEGKRRYLSLTGNIINHTFAENSAFNNISEDVNFIFSHEFSEYDRISLSNSFSHTEAPLFSSEDFYVDQFGRPNGRWDYFKNRLNFYYSRDINKQLSASFRYANTLDLYSGIDIPGSFSNKPGISANYSFTPSTSFSLSYDYLDVQFDNEMDAAEHAIALGVTQNITKRLSFSMGTGRDFINSFDIENFAKQNYSASISYEKDINTRVSISFYKDYAVTPFVPDIFEQWNSTLSLSREISERINYNLSTFYGKGEYIIGNYEQTLMGATSTFSYAIYKNLFGSFTYSYIKSDYDIDTLGYSKNTFYLGLTAAF